MSPDFWDTEQFRDAFAVQHIGQVSRAYRKHPRHIELYGKDGIPQEIVAGWLNLTQAQISRIENGAPIRHLDNLVRWATTLRIPEPLLWFRFPIRRKHESADYLPRTCPDLTLVHRNGQEFLEIDDVNRRELLRLLSMAGTVLAMSQIEGQLDWERMGSVASRTRQLDGATVDQYEALNSHLWRVFALSKIKAATFPLVRDQLDVLVEGLQRSQRPALHRRLCALAGDLFQLAGEIFFDANRYTDAAHCYTLAATASREANQFDLWACALTRHAFIGVYERQFGRAASMLELAANLARRGDSGLSTRYWVSTVQAEAFAGLGELHACQQALQHAEQVHQLDGQIHTGGWLRFDGSRLAEERGACYIALQRPDLAEAALSDALSQDLSARRRGIVLTDLATLGMQRRDLNELVTYANAALETARQTGSGVVGRKLLDLQAQLLPLLDDRRVRQVHSEITSLTKVSVR